MIDRLPPQSLEAEQSVLGAILIDRDAIIEVAEFLRPEDFYRPSHGVIWAAMLDLYEQGEPVDKLTVVERLKQATAAADKEALVGKTLATRAQKKSGGLIEILMGEVEDEKNPVSGAMMNRRKDVVRPEQMTDRLWFEPTATEEVPAEFYVPAGATASLDLLRKHGIQMRQVTAPVNGIEQFAISSNTARPPTGSIDTQQHALRTLEGKWEPAAGVTVPAGSYAVPMNQPLARRNTFPVTSVAWPSPSTRSSPSFDST